MFWSHTIFFVWVTSPNSSNHSLPIIIHTGAVAKSMESHRIVSYKLAIPRKKGRILSLYPVIQFRKSKLLNTKLQLSFLFYWFFYSILQKQADAPTLTSLMPTYSWFFDWNMWRKKLESYSLLITNHIYHMTLKHLAYSTETYLSILLSFKGVFLVLFELQRCSYWMEKSKKSYKSSNFACHRKVWNDTRVNLNQIFIFE